MLYSMWKGYLQGDKEDKSVTAFLDGYHYDCVHTSGHAYVETIAELAEAVNPKLLVPMHTQEPEAFRELPRLANLKERIRVLEDGEVLEL